MKRFFPIVFLVLILSCSDEKIDDPIEPPVVDELYFPSIATNTWETTDITSLGWDASQLEDLYDYLQTNQTRAFIILKDGKIVVEQYWGNGILNLTPFDENSVWYWASAGKTIISFLIGIAQQENQLNIQNKTSDYLGAGWTSLSQDKEDLITVRHQLTMTTGLDYTISDQNCTDPSCLTYKMDAGEQWYYHNAPYLLLKSVLTNATGIAYDVYTDEKLEAHTGMSGDWLGDETAMYWSTARDMARFGLLILNKGKWEDNQILTDQNYFDDMISTSQSLNPSYGYLWWLNGKSSIIYPSSPETFNLELASNAPSDLFAGMGANGQFVDIVPSQGLVVIRMGEEPGDSLVPAEFHDGMWEKINLVIK